MLIPKDMERGISRIVNLLIKNHSKELTMQNSIKHFKKINIESIKNGYVKSIGAEPFGPWNKKKFETPEILAQTGSNQNNYLSVSINN